MSPNFNGAPLKDSILGGVERGQAKRRKSGSELNRTPGVGGGLHGWFLVSARWAVRVHFLDCVLQAGASNNSEVSQTSRNRIASR